MKRRLGILLIISFVLIFSVSFASANLFSDVWNKITGKVTYICGNGILDPGELCDYAATDSVNNPYGNQCSSNCWVNGAPPYWQGCRGSGAHVCIDAPDVTDQYFIDHPLCIKNPTCAGQFYNCNGVVCPSLSSTTTPVTNQTNQTNTTTSTCIDSDGGNNYDVKGTLNFNNVYYSDSCTSSGLLSELYCILNNTAYGSALYNCPGGCSNGACLPAPPAPITTCTDSDGGNNYYVKGTLNFNNANYLDSCISPGLLNESYCNNTAYGSALYNCPGGCSNGACLPAPPAPITTCTDSDGGNNYYVKGTVTDKNLIVNTDLCLPTTPAGQQVREYSCGNDSLTNFSYYNCPYGCSNGACLTSNAETAEQVNTPPIQINEGGTAAGNNNCQGCLDGDKCYSIGYRKSGEYCSINLNFISQSGEGTLCENNFECQTNLCIENQCISQGIIEMIIEWFKKIF